MQPTDHDEVRLLEIFRALSASDRHALQAYAEFLSVRGGTVGVDAVTAKPQPESRPEGESVVMAIRRLTRTYPMLDRRKLMGQTSQLMAEHALQGRAVVEVIEELELLFARHYHDAVRHADNVKHES
jgi:hypothetical protein